MEAGGRLAPVNQTEFDGYLLGCGTMAQYRGEVLWHRTFPQEQGRRIMNAMDRWGIDALLEGSEKTIPGNWRNSIQSFSVST